MRTCKIKNRCVINIKIRSASFLIIKPETFVLLLVRYREVCVCVCVCVCCVSVVFWWYCEFVLSRHLQLSAVTQMKNRLSKSLSSLSYLTAFFCRNTHRCCSASPWQQTPKLKAARPTHTHTHTHTHTVYTDFV